MSRTTIHLAIMSAYPALLFALYFITSSMEAPVPFSAGSFIQPYYRESSLPSIVLGSLALGYPLLYLLFLFPLFSREKGTELVLFAMSETPALIGFAIGFLNVNFWAAVPYFAVSVALYAYSLLKLPGR